MSEDEKPYDVAFHENQIDQMEAARPRSSAGSASVREALELAEDVLSRAPFSTGFWPNGMHPQTGIDKIRDAIRSLNEPQAVARPPIALGDMVYMDERSPYFHDWKGVSFKVVSLRIEPDRKLWASVIEGEQRHRGNGVYDAETTDVDTEYLSPLSGRD